MGWEGGRADIWESHGREDKCRKSWRKETAWKIEALMIDNIKIRLL